MDSNNRKDYDDFFKPSDEQKRQEQQEQQERPSYYYSYGPYKSSAEEGNHGRYPEQDMSDSVEVTAPRPVRPYPYMNGSYSQQEPERPEPLHTPEPHKRSSLKGMFAAFMAGALVVSSLMFASDKMNLFTGGSASGSGGSGSPVSSASTANAAGSGSGNIQGAAYDVSRPGTVSAIVQQASPAVVKIESFVTVSSRQRSNSIYNDPFFRYFFGDQGSQQQQQQPNQKQKSGMGTGFIFEKSGYILTNQHVIEGADEIQVTVEGYEKPFTAELLGNSFDLDLAVLKIKGDKDFPILPIGDSGNMKIGDWVVAIGNPYGFEHTVTVGVLSAKEREISIPESSSTRNYKHLLQTDASINPGNSGGPLLNMNGEVIGINTAVNSEAQGIGFAIPTSTITDVIDNLKNNVEIPKEPIPFIGASLGNVSELAADAVKELKLDKAEGAYVADVVIGTPAFRAGLKKYDVIQSINGTAYTGSQEIITKIQSMKVGDKVTFGIIRDGQKMNLDITLGDKNEYNKQNSQQSTQNNGGN